MSVTGRWCASLANRGTHEERDAKAVAMVLKAQEAQAQALGGSGEGHLSEKELKKLNHKKLRQHAQDVGVDKDEMASGFSTIKDSLVRLFTGANPAKIAPAKTPSQRARENLIQVLFNHNDFVTVR